LSSKSATLPGTLPKLCHYSSEYNAGFCNILINHRRPLSQASAQATSTVGYIRSPWPSLRHLFSDDPAVPANERYNYLYTSAELAPWISRVRKVAGHSRDTFVVTNNHFQGKSVVNALQLISILKAQKSKFPTSPPHYPELDDIAESSSR